MSIPAQRQPRQRLLTVEEYLAREASAAVRHEYVAGRVYAMAGEKRRHNRIAGNIYAHLLAAIGDGPCRISFEGVKVQATRDIFYYPDVMIACGPEPEDPHLETEPCLLVEVLSPSTQHTDQREKALIYKGIASLRAYVIVHQERRRVEYYAREADGRWTAGDFVGNALLDFPCPADAAPMTFDQVYRGAEPAVADTFGDAAAE